jgi:phospholipase/carboxylesterase
MTQNFEHIFIDNQAQKTLVLLHGTGGTKADFLFLDAALHHSYNLLGLQGNVVEQGMSRFFRRSAPGVFDQESIASETDKLHAFLAQWSAEQHQSLTDLIFCGYSNGANMILALLFRYPTDVSTAVLLHPMLPFIPESLALKDAKLFVTHGEADEMVMTAQQTELNQVLQNSGATVAIHNYEGGHSVSQTELRDVVSFLKQHYN